MSTMIATGGQPAEQPAARPERRPTARTVLMCRPEHFTVSLPHQPVDGPGRARPTPASPCAQWQALYDTYIGLGYDVQLIDPIEGLPDMVYAANGGFVIDGIAYGAKFTYPERQPEGPAYMDWFRDAGFDVREPGRGQRGRGRLPARRRHDPRRHRLPQRLATATTSSRAIFGREVVTPHASSTRASTTSTPRSPCSTRRPAARSNIAYLPSAFDEASRRDPAPSATPTRSSSTRGRRGARPQLVQRRLQRASSPSRAKGFERQLRERGYNPIGVDLSELLLGGGGVKCCTLELRR